MKPPTMTTVDIVIIDNRSARGCHKVTNLRNSLPCLTDLFPQSMLLISIMLVKFMMRPGHSGNDKEGDDDFLVKFL